MSRSAVVLISQLKGAVHPLVLIDQGISPPPCFIIHNLNHGRICFLLLGSCLFVLPRLAIAYLSLHLTLHWCVDLSTYVILSCDIFFVLCTNHLLCQNSTSVPNPYRP